MKKKSVDLDDIEILGSAEPHKESIIFDWFKDNKYGYAQQIASHYDIAESFPRRKLKSLSEKGLLTDLGLKRINDKKRNLKHITVHLYMRKE